MSPVVATLVVLALAMAAFLAGRVPPAVVAVASAIALWATGVIPLDYVFAGFGDPTVVFVAGLFVVSTALQSTGVAAKAAVVIAGRTSRGSRGALPRLMLLVAGLTPFTIPSGAVGATMPSASIAAVQLGVPPSRLLLPAAFAAHAGSMLLLTGTPVNAIVSQQAAENGGRHFGYLEFGLVGIPLVLGTVFIALLVSDRLLVDRAPASPPVEIETHVAPVGRRGWTALTVIIAMVVTLATGALPPAIVAAMAAGAMVLLRVIQLDEALRRVPWGAVLLIAGMLPMSTAFERSGAADLIGAQIIRLSGEAGAPVALLVVCLVTIALGQFVTNMATTLIVAPIAIAVAGSLGVSVMPFMMALTVAAAASFLTPMATPSNAMVLEPGGYRFGDYARYGIPFAVLFLAVAVLVVPVFWPF